jgi:hypothetical protein
MQQAKHLAVEAMHAVRDYAGGEPNTFLKTLRSIRNELVGYLGGVGLQPTSHLRRAPRPNEMYYVMRAEMLTELVESMLGIRKSPIENVS